MHHGHLFHASIIKTNDRRIGCAIRYIKPSMKQLTGDKSLVTLVSGVIGMAILKMVANLLDV